MNSIKSYYIKYVIIYFTMQALIRIILDGAIEIRLSAILALVVSFTAVFVPLHDFYKSKNYSENYHKLCVGAGVLIYSIGEMMQLYSETIQEEAAMHTGMGFYLSRNVMIMAALLIIILKYAGKWNELRVIVDIFVFGIFAVYISWIGFIKLYMVDFDFAALDTAISVAYIITDTIIIFEYLMLYMYEVDYFKSFAKKTEMSGFMILLAADFCNWYGVALNGYAGAILEAALPISLLMISIGMNEDEILAKNHEEKGRLSVEAVSALILCIICFIAINMSLSMPIGILFICTIAFRIIARKYIRAYEINEELMKNYIDANDMLKSKMYEANKIFCDLESKVRLRTQELKEKNTELFYLSNIDFLTGVPNRRSFVEYIDSLIFESSTKYKFAIMFIDIDRFKSINDWYGHDVGDHILIETSKRLSQSLGDEDRVYRLGGDEYVVVLSKIKNEDSVMKIANEMVCELRKPFLIKDKKIFTTISVGIACYPLNASERSSLMKCADIALYKSKSEGKNMASIYNLSMKIEENRRLEIESRFYEAIENDEFYLRYQPQIELSTGRILGIEALVRWKCTGLGDIEPREFLGISEENGLIISLGNMVMEESIRTIKHLNSKYDMELKVAINISPRQFMEHDFISKLREYIFHYDVNSSWIELEITEELTMNNEELVLAKLIEISNMGVKIAIDNFGRGYSSFLYLKKFPINTIKIAMELVKGIGDRIEDYKIVKSIISMCRDMEIEVIAEGFENQIQWNILKNIGCYSVQGYFSGGLMTMEEIERKYCIKRETKEETL